MVHVSDYSIYTHSINHLFSHICSSDNIHNAFNTTAASESFANCRYRFVSGRLPQCLGQARHRLVSLFNRMQRKVQPIVVPLLEVTNKQLQAQTGCFFSGRLVLDSGPLLVGWFICLLNINGPCVSQSIFIYDALVATFCIAWEITTVELSRIELKCNRNKVHLIHVDITLVTFIYYTFASYRKFSGKNEKYLIDTWNLCFEFR